MWPDGCELSTYQAEVLTALSEHRRVTVRGPHALGKSTLCALAVLHHALSRDAAGVNWKILTTASSWRQLEKYLWPEIRLWSRRVRWEAVGRAPFDQKELLALTLRLEYGEAFAGASDDPALLEGCHADSVLIVFDESKSIPAATWESLEGALSGQGEALALAVSTPGAPSGMFHAIHTRRPGTEDWHVRAVTLEESIAANRISRQWAEQRARQWGVGSAVYQTRVLGEFADNDEDGIVPLSWVESACERWRTWDDAGGPQGDEAPVIGVDVGRGGDKTVLAVRRGDVIEYLERHNDADVMATTGYVVSKLSTGGTAVVDVIGIGAGVVDRLREMKRNVVAFNASARSMLKDRSGELMFLNERAAMWWRMRESLDPASDAKLALPPDDELVGDLTAPRWTVNSSGRIQVEGKDEVRRRIGRSTDAADAAIMSLGPSATRPRRKRRMMMTARNETLAERSSLGHLERHYTYLRRRG